jgi:hypothetical protein
MLSPAAAPVVNAFISHAAEDEIAALTLRTRLAEEGIECWCFEEDLRFSEHIDDRVMQALDNSDCIIVILSPAGLESEWVRWELGYARQLHQQRGGVPRPCLIPVHAYDQLPEPLEIQPLRLRTAEPIGSPLAFHRHRCYRLRDETMVPSLARSMRPSLTRVTEPSGKHERLFDGIAELIDELFPNELDRPHPEQIRDWLNDNLHNPTASPWTEFLLAAHIGEDVMGFAYLNYSHHYAYGYAPFLGISPAWRSRTRIGWLLEQSKAEMTRICPTCRGVLFEVELFDSHVIRRDGELGDQASERAMNLHRVHLFQSFGARVLVDHANNPIRLPQPSLALPLGPETEVDHMLMVLPAVTSDAPQCDDELIDTYLSLWSAGFGPDGANIPGYMQYLETFAERLKKCIPRDAAFRKLYFSPEMRTVMKRPR